jgi:hypothetical protein
LERYQLKAKSTGGDAMLECEEELAKQFNAGGFPYVTLRLANTIGPRENTIRYWLLHLWIRAHLALTLPMHLDENLLEEPMSLTYTPDIAQAVSRSISMARDETCCSEKVLGEAFNLACEEAPTQSMLYNHIAEPIHVPYVETVEMRANESVVLYPEIVRAPVSSVKAWEVLRWSPTDLRKAIRSVARFYDRVMLTDSKKHSWEKRLMVARTKAILGNDGPPVVNWLTAFYDEKRKNELYDELDDEDEDDVVLTRPDPEKSRKKQRRRKQGSRKGSSKSEL